MQDRAGVGIEQGYGPGSSAWCGQPGFQGTTRGQLTLVSSQLEGGARLPVSHSSSWGMDALAR